MNDQMSTFPRRKFIFDTEGTFDDPITLISPVGFWDQIIVFRFGRPCLKYTPREYPPLLTIDRAVAWDLFRTATFNHRRIDSLLDCKRLLLAGGPTVEPDDLRPFLDSRGQFRVDYAASEISAARQDRTFFFPRHFKIMGDYFFLREYDFGRRSELLLIKPIPSLTNAWERLSKSNACTDAVTLCAGTTVTLLPATTTEPGPVLPSGDQVFEDEEI